MSLRDGWTRRLLLSHNKIAQRDFGQHAVGQAKTLQMDYVGGKGQEIGEEVDGVDPLDFF
jgi:hypothetical protein